MYTIKRAAELTGVPVATLRAWERRYGLGKTERTDSGYRLYDDATLADIRAMRLLLDAGWAPAQAAAEVQRLRGEIGAVLPPGAVGDVQAFAVLQEEFVAAAHALDAGRLSAVLDHAFGLADFEAVVDGWLAASLAELGARWAAGTMDVSVEHFASAAVMRKLGVVFESTPEVLAAPRVLIGLGPGCRHEIGPLAFAAAIRRQGLAAVYLGADLPEEAWVRAAHAERAVAAVVSVAIPGDEAATRRVLSALAASHPDLQRYAGGRLGANMEDQATALEPGLAAAARQMATALIPKELVL